MKSTLLVASLIPLITPLVNAQLGDGGRALTFGPGYQFKVSAGNEIIRAETTYTPGAMEKNIQGILFLWPGIWVPEQRETGDLIQTVIEGSKSAMECRGKPGQWCMAPYVMHGVIKADRERKQVAIDPDAKIRIIYSKTADGSKWVQTTIDTSTEALLQNYTGGVGKKTQFDFATEMQYGNQGSTSVQIYTDTVITLAEPDMKFGTGRKKVNAVVTGVTSEQDGKVWKIKRCELPAMRTNAENHPATGNAIRGG